MPPKYRRMADFHEFYSGNRRAPFLTIFIGGNHEASNHLFELYYGGWVAPNVYYMGAANILRLGPLRIAGLSGIWKGYDYRKPHFERVPYNEGESVSIFHVRELDVRKMLSVQTQVDVGLSHDWPQGVEWKGDYQGLFRKKDRFEADANDGKLGSIAAKQCLDRLRPSHWFSAHLHIKYAALIQHGNYEWVRPPREPRPRNGAPLRESAPSRASAESKHETASNFPDKFTGPSVQNDLQPQTDERLTKENSPTTRSTTSPSITKNFLPAQKSPEHAQVSAWQNFHVDAVKQEAQDTDRQLREQRERTAEEERTGVRSSPQYTFDETWKQVQLRDSAGRDIASVSKATRAPGEDGKIPSVDGCVESRLKRPRPTTPEDVHKNGQAPYQPKIRNGLFSQLNGQMPASTIRGLTTMRNTDEIEIDLSDTSLEDDGAEAGLSSPKPSNMVAIERSKDGFSRMSREKHPKRAKAEGMMSDDSDEGGVKLDPTSPPFVPRAESIIQSASVKGKINEEPMTTPEKMDVDQDGVSEAMRAQLTELSSSFASGRTKQPVSAALPLPAGITNTTTQFLALDKCEKGRDFLQLLELDSISQPSQASGARPYRLQYDPEWLAILRVFAPELELGGEPNGAIPQHKGDTHYQERIIEEEKWIGEHVVRSDRLTVPENFTMTAPIYDPNEEVAITDSPREYTNPQTSAFCQLIGIENKFDFDEDGREERRARGPRPAESGFSRDGRGGGRGFGGGGYGGRGRGGYNGGRGGRGRGRGGRGRGRGGW